MQKNVDTIKKKSRAQKLRTKPSLGARGWSIYQEKENARGREMFLPIAEPQPYRIHNNFCPSGGLMGTWIGT